MTHLVTSRNFHNKGQNNDRIAADCERKKQDKNLKSVLHRLSVGYILRFLSRLAFFANK